MLIERDAERDRTRTVGVYIDNCKKKSVNRYCQSDGIFVSEDAWQGEVVALSHSSRLVSQPHYDWTAMPRSRYNHECFGPHEWHKVSQTRQEYLFFLGRAGKLICVGVFVSVSVREHVCVCVFYFGSCIPMARCRRRQPTARNQCIDAISTHLHPYTAFSVYFWGADLS